MGCRYMFYYIRPRFLFSNVEWTFSWISHCRRRYNNFINFLCWRSYTLVFTKSSVEYRYKSIKLHYLTLYTGQTKHNSIWFILTRNINCDRKKTQNPTPLFGKSGAWENESSVNYWAFSFCNCIPYDKVRAKHDNRNLLQHTWCYCVYRT